MTVWPWQIVVDPDVLIVAGGLLFTVTATGVETAAHPEGLFTVTE